jgi:predicted membrane protein
MKTNVIIRIVLFSLAIVILSGILAAGLLAGQLSFSIPSFTKDSEKTVSDSGSVSASEVQNLDIDWVAGSVIIQPGDVDTITFTEKSTPGTDKMVWKQTGNTLFIEHSKTKVYIGFSIDQSKDLLITVPRDWVCGKMSIDTASANIQVSDLQIQNADFDSASGTCTLTNCNVDNISVDTASGDVDFIGTFNTIELSAASAKCTMVLSNVPRLIEVDTMSGDLDITLPSDCGFTVDMDGMSGDFTSDFPTSTTNGNHVFGNGSCRIIVDAMSSDLTIRKGQS